jgi:dihydrofolate synthase/folylpolyglutamate synthase
VGLGGRLDATTCHPGREVVGFGAIDLDHAEVLGPDVAAIAAQKAGILRTGAVAVSAAQPPPAAAVLRAQARAVGADLRWQPPLDRRRWPLGLSGTMQAHNGAVALGMLRALAERGWPISDDAIARGFAAARWPGRLQRRRWRGIPLLLDGAHNPAAARALRAELDGEPEGHGLPPGPRRWVLGILASKEGAAILEALLAPGDRAWIVPVAGHPSWTLPELRRALAGGPQAQLGERLQAAPDAATAIGEAAGSWPADGPVNRPVIVAGSLYLIGQLLAAAEP